MDCFKDLVATDNANDAYFAKLIGNVPTPLRKRGNAKRYVPNFSIAKGSLEPTKISRRKWAEAVFECEMDVTPLDIEYFKTETCPLEIDEHFAYMASDVKRDAEVSLKWLSSADKKKFAEAQGKEMDQWLENAVFSIAKRAGVPVDRIMSMRWILTW